MKIMQVQRLRNTDHADMRAGLENWEKHRATGIEALWMSADGKTLFTLYDIDDPREMQKTYYLYAPYFEHVETHVVTDVSVGVPIMKEALDMAP